MWQTWRYIHHVLQVLRFKPVSGFLKQQSVYYQETNANELSLTERIFRSSILMCRQLLAHPIAWLVMHSMFRLKVEGREHLEQALKKHGPLILAGNHTGYLDSLILLSAIRQPLQFLMNSSVYQWESVGWLVKRGGLIPVTEGKEHYGLKACIQWLKTRKEQGNRSLLCIFPEGKLTKNGQLQAFQDGVAFIHQQSQTPVLPFAIIGGFNAWAEGTRAKFFSPITLRFGAAITQGGDQIITGKASRQAFTNQLKSNIMNLIQPDDAIENNPLVLPETLSA